MKSFPTPLFLRALSPEELAAGGMDHQFYAISGAPFVYESALFGRLEVPVGMLTDFASIPRIVWNILSPEDPVILFASVVHDYIYTNLGSVSGITLTREQADKVLREAMEICGASAWQRWAVFKAVRTFGGSHWADKAAA